MAEEQYDMSPKMRDLFERKHKQRTASKDFWRKQLYNPYLQKEPFDPVLFRHSAVSAYSATYYKPNYKRKAAVFFCLSPMLILGWFVYNSRNKREMEYRSGRVAYEDREEKLML